MTALEMISLALSRGIVVDPQPGLTAFIRNANGHVYMKAYMEDLTDSNAEDMFILAKRSINKRMFG